MNRFYSLAIVTGLGFAIAVVAQNMAMAAAAQTGTAESQNVANQGQSKSDSPAAGVPAVADQLKVLAEKLALSDDQQAKVVPILETLHDATLKIVLDESLSNDERLDKVRPLRMKADKEIREILDDGQKKKLDQFEQGPHPEMHGNLSGSAPPPQR